MGISTWHKLAELFDVEIKGEWLKQYPRKEFIEQKVKYTFYWCDKSGIVPPEKEDWKRLIEKIMREDWPKSSYKSTMAFVPKQVPVGPTTQKIDYEPKCSFCLDSTVVRVLSDDAKIDTLMLCDCVEIEDRSNWDLPQWDNALSMIYRKERCPMEWFVPKANDEADIAKKVDGHAKRVRMAVQFWKEKLTEAEA